MNLLITGAIGLLGGRIAEHADSRGDSVFSGYLAHHPPFGYSLKLDVTSPQSVSEAFRRARPDVVFHTAAITGVDRCELERDLAVQVNVEGTRNVAEAARDSRAYLVFLSSDYVFDGSRGLYKEDDERNPVNFLGKTKVLAEDIVRSSGARHLVARTSFIFGSRAARGETNFALWAIRKLKAHAPFRVVADQFITPTYDRNLVRMLFEAADKRLEGTLHLAGATRLSKYGFAFSIAKSFGLDWELLIPSSMDEMGWVAERPVDSSLDTSRARALLDNKPMELSESLKRLRDEIPE
ncbi:MAG: NAD(P)-dependent oxidoreductase [Candidatus Methanosuratincola petrocarbonis]